MISALTGNCLVLLLYLDCITNQRSIPFGYILHLLVLGLICWSGFCIAEEIDGIGDKVSGYITTVAVRTHLEAFLNLSPRSTNNAD
jgi:hypothetical protein